MKIEKIKLSQVSVNNANPRTITGEKFAKLINSILVFPKMMEIRPVVIDNAYKALGGNMRTQALNAIKAMSLEDIQNRLDTQKDYIKMPVEQKKALVTFWSEWLANPTTYIIKADSLSAAEKEQFIIKDNVAYGAWDFDALANQFDNAALNDWGMDVWQMPTATPMGGFTPTAQSNEGTTNNGIDESEVDEDVNYDELFVQATEFANEKKATGVTICISLPEEEAVNKDSIKEKISEALAGIKFTMA